MLTTIIDSYKLFFKQFKTIFILSLPLLVLSVANLYFQPASKIIYCSYAIMLLMPLVNAATDISIYRKLFQYNIINPLSNINAFVIYLLAQILIGIIGTLPIYLFQYLFLLCGMSAFWSLACAVLLNIPSGFYVMARLNIILPLIIQNKVPSWKEFVKYTAQPYSQWLFVAVLVYFPYVLLHYLSVPCPYTHILVTTYSMFVFICFNVTYVNNHRLGFANYKPVKDLVQEAEVIISAPESVKPEKEVAKAPKKAQPKKTPVKKVPVKKTATKKTPKPKLKPATV